MNMKDHNHSILSSRHQDEESSSWRRFRHLPLLAMTVLAVGYVVFQKIYRCIRPPPPFEARDGDTVVDEEVSEDDDDHDDKRTRNHAENREDERHTDESSLTEVAVSSSDS